MPSPSTILEGLASISSLNVLLAAVWHIIFGAAIIGLIVGWRPSRKFTAIALAVPLLSVSILAWIYKNPFNGIVFLLFAALLVFFGFRMSNEKIPCAPSWSIIAGAIMIAFGWIYPHFIDSGNWFKYLYATPTGLIPCPTLSITIGFALLANWAFSRIWPVLLVIIGLFYGLFGFFRLGVKIDIVLFVGAIVLLIQAFTLKSSKN